MCVTSFDLFCQLTVASGGGFQKFYSTLGWETRWTQPATCSLQGLISTTPSLSRTNKSSILFLFIDRMSVGEWVSGTCLDF